jgi:hypothetical protein
VAGVAGGEQHVAAEHPGGSGDQQLHFGRGGVSTGERRLAIDGDHGETGFRSPVDETTVSADDSAAYLHGKRRVRSVIGGQGVSYGEGQRGRHQLPVQRMDLQLHESRNRADRGHRRGAIELSPVDPLPESIGALNEEQIGGVQLVVHLAGMKQRRSSRCRQRLLDIERDHDAGIDDDRRHALPVAVFADQLGSGGGTGGKRMGRPDSVGILEELIERDSGPSGEAAAKQLDRLRSERASGRGRLLPKPLVKL